MTAVNQATKQSSADTLPDYLGVVGGIARVHQQLLKAIGAGLAKHSRYDITPTQALIVYNLGDRELRASELMTRGCYQGSNVSYNLNKLVAMGLLDRRRADDDRREVRVRLTASGSAVWAIIDDLFRQHASIIARFVGPGGHDLAALSSSLKTIERFWSGVIIG